MSFKKMDLVPFEMVGRMSGNNLSALKTPNETQVAKNMDGMTSVLADETLTGNQKMNRFNEEYSFAKIQFLQTKSSTLNLQRNHQISSSSSSSCRRKITCLELYQKLHKIMQMH